MAGKKQEDSRNAHIIENEKMSNSSIPVSNPFDILEGEEDRVIDVNLLATYSNKLINAYDKGGEAEDESP
jgi:hypothetical protein